MLWCGRPARTNPDIHNVRAGRPHHKADAETLWWHASRVLGLPRRSAKGEAGWV